MYARADIDAQTRDSADPGIDANNEDADLPLRMTANHDLDEEESTDGDDNFIFFAHDGDSTDSSDDEF